MADLKGKTHKLDGAVTDRRWCLIICAIVTLGPNPHAVAAEPRNVILITIDGLRWQEVFGGADRRLMNETDGGVKQPEKLEQRFYREDPVQRRQVLMPFFWTTVAAQGQVFGSPAHRSTVTVTNEQYFSYPGYSEILCGFGDPAIASNDKVNNANVTVLEWLNRKPTYRDRVAAFTSWDVFPFIINSNRSGIYVNAGWQPLEHIQDAASKNAYNQLADELPRYWDNVRYDAFTFRGAVEYLKTNKPRVLYVALGETDDWAHAGRYDLYLDAANRSDVFIQRLWETAQSMEPYRDKTSLIITTDHGRGDGREDWKSHSAAIPGSERVWIAVLGPDIASRGVLSDLHVTQSQIAATVAMLLGEQFVTMDKRIADPLKVTSAAIPHP